MVDNPGSAGTASDPWRVVPSFAVDRPGLVDRLETALTRPIVEVVAPAGHGKSVLLAQWAAAHPERTVVWLSARGVGRDASRFSRLLAEALAEVAPDRPRLRPGFGVDDLLQQLAALPDVVVVVEDLEEVKSADVLGVLGELAQQLPSNIRLILISRRDPDIGLHRPRLRDEVDEIRQGELDLTEDQVASVVFALAGCHLRGDQAAALTRRTEGWAAGVQLAALALRDREDVDSYVEAFSGDDRHVADYLSDEILYGLEDEEREFLLVTSILEHLDAPICNALTGRTDGQATIDSLHRRALFVIPEGDRRLYRYHTLFRDLLRYELRTQRPDDEPELHRVAAAAFLQAGRPADAARHLIAAADWPGVVQLARRKWSQYLERDEVWVVLSWVEQVPPDLVEADPSLALLIAHLRLLAGQALSAQVLAERTAADHDLSADLALRVDVIRSLLVFHHAAPADVLAAAHRILDAGPSEGGADLDVEEVQLTARLCAGQAELLLGHVDAARTWLGGAEDSRQPLNWARVLGIRAYADALSGRLVHAEQAARRALTVAEEIGVLDHPWCVGAHLALGHVMIERHQLAAAAAHLRDAQELARRKRSQVQVTAARIEREALAMAAGRAGHGEAAGADVTALDSPPPPYLRTIEVALAARAAIAAGRTELSSTLLDDPTLIEVTDLAAARAALAAELRDHGALQKLVDHWPEVDGAEPRSLVQHHLWQAVVLDGNGQTAAAGQCIDTALAITEREGMVQVLRDGGPAVARCLRRHYRNRPTPYLRQQIEGLDEVQGPGQSPELVEQLSEREMEVLRYLPSRLSNAEIAARLYVSVNTLKTHLKAIYRKLGVTSRSEAVERGEDLGLA
jgi:LuxR family maltose regulon positive regulatory protein